MEAIGKRSSRRGGVNSASLWLNHMPQTKPHAFLLCVSLLLLYAPLTVAQEDTPVPSPTVNSCDTSPRPISCVSYWWNHDATPAKLVGAAVLMFFATFLPRVLVRLVIFVLTKVPFVIQTAEDFREHCSGSSAYLMSASLVILAFSVSDVDSFLYNLHRYIWGIFFIVWLYTLFNVVESLAVRRFVGANGDVSKRVVISESIKILRLTTLLVIALIIYSSAVGQQELLKYSVLAVIGLAIALGFVPSFHNVVGGLFLAFNSQFKIDDFIEVGAVQGFVHRVSLRYTTVITSEGTQMYVPNSFFLYKPMVNFSQRPKRAIDIRVRVAPSTPVDTLREAVRKLEIMLQSLHMGLTSHEENQSDLRHGEKWERFFFVAMEDLYELRVYSYTDELDDRKYAMIRTEVWLALMETMEELDVEVLNDYDDEDSSVREMSKTAAATFTVGGRSARNSPRRTELESPFAAEMNMVIGANGARTAL